MLMYKRQVSLVVSVLGKVTRHYRLTKKTWCPKLSPIIIEAICICLI